MNNEINDDKQSHAPGLGSDAKRYGRLHPLRAEMLFETSSSASAEEFDFDSPAIPTSELIKWKSELQPNNLLVLITGHGNCTHTEWGNLYVSPVSVFSVLTAPLGQSAYLDSSGYQAMMSSLKDDFFDPHAPISKGAFATKLISKIKSAIVLGAPGDGDDQDSKRAYKLSRPFFAEVTNQFRNRSWEFNAGTPPETIFFAYVKNGEKHLIPYNFDEDTYLNHTTKDGTHTIFKANVIAHIERLITTGEVSGSTLLIDSTCNKLSKDPEQSHQQWRKIESIVDGTGAMPGLQINRRAFGGRKHKTLKKSLKRRKKSIKRRHI